MRCPTLTAASLALTIAARSEATPQGGRQHPLRGSITKTIDPATWQGWEPSASFARQYAGWKDKAVPDEIQVWCKGFISDNATTERISGHSVMPIKGPGNVPIPGLLGMCASTDGRSWSSQPPSTSRTTDSRFWATMSVARGRGPSTTAFGNCGYSHNICCQKEGCGMVSKAKYGEITCSKHCPDDEIQAIRQACWSLDAVKGGVWEKEGKNCSQLGEIAAAKVYIVGRGGNPCGVVMGVNPPPASWDVGMAIFPTKRKVTITGLVDDAPSYECYAHAKDHGSWGKPVTLARIPDLMRANIAVELAGWPDKPVNPQGLVFDLPEPAAIGGDEEIVV